MKTTVKARNVELTGQLRSQIDRKLHRLDRIAHAEAEASIELTTHASRAAETANVAEVHNEIRALLADIYGAPSAKMRILYGGSVKPSNCSSLLTLENVDGALVGGASLKATEFLAIAAAYR